MPYAICFHCECTLSPQEELDNGSVHPLAEKCVNCPAGSKPENHYSCNRCYRTLVAEKKVRELENTVTELRSKLNIEKSNKEEHKVELYAFWNYDKFPFLLHGLVTEIDHIGNVKIKGYGEFVFRPLKILPAESGKEIGKKLNELRTKFEQDEKELVKKWNEKVKDLFPNDFFPADWGS